MKKLAIVFLAVALSTGYAYAGILYSQSFEDPALLGGQYHDFTVDGGTFDHDLINNVGEAAVDGPGFDATFLTNGGVGLTDGDYCGVTTYTPAIGYYTDGIAGYQISDSDGIFVLTFDDFPTAQVVNFDLFVATTGYETSSPEDFITITCGGTTILNTQGSDINDLGLEGYWNTYSTVVSGGALQIVFASNAGTEVIFIDNIVIADDLTIPNNDTTWSGVKSLYR